MRARRESIHMTEDEINEAARDRKWLKYTGDAFRWRHVIVIPLCERTRARKERDGVFRIGIQDSKGHMDRIPIADFRRATVVELSQAGINPITDLRAPTPNELEAAGL